MTQSAKFIDVTKTFLPVDPMAFPESMHGTGQEDTPEGRIPSAAYEGYNFLPTSYGYKSYFGTNQDLGVDALTSRADYVIAFQSETFENFLVAMCDDGLWIKNSTQSGAWTHVRTVTPDINPLIHFMWTYTVINDKLLCYMQGLSVVFQIEGSATAPFYTVTDIAPTFLNMSAQMGIFRAGGRLGFWDTEDSVGWSSLDDLGEFTPDLESLAGNALFSDVNGRIVTIRPHGEGFIIYASQSIVYIEEQAEATYQWKPKVLLSNSGIAYPEECTVGIPDTLHFAYTNTGLYKIDNQRLDNIVPEVVDYLKESRKPIYPKILEGRYLFLQTIDPDYLTGLVEFKDEVVPEGTYTFPGASGTLADAVADEQLRGTDVCATYGGINNADYDDMQPGKPGGPPAIPDQKPGTNATPIWTCYISNNSVLDPADLTFGDTPCSSTDPNGVTKGMSPVGKSGRLDAMTQDSTNKKPLLGSDVYVDGIWTIERFVSLQTAIWDKEKQNAKALIDKILNRSAEGQKLEYVGTCAESNVYSECVIGDYVSDYSDPQFGFSKCEFWLTRYAISAVTIKTQYNTRVACEFMPAHQVPPASYTLWQQAAGPYSYASPEAACNAGGGTYYPITGVAQLISTACCTNPVGECSASLTASRQWDCPSYPGGFPSVSKTFGNVRVEGGAQSGTVTVAQCTVASHYEKTTYYYAYNRAAHKDITPTPETAYCTITGWKYTKTDGTQGTAPAAACTAPASSPAGGPARTMPLQTNPEETNVPISGSGSICSKPFEPVTIPGTPPVVVDWPTTTVTIPEGSFLMQDGSIAPVYPDFFGALVYDLQLKKWGKMKAGFKALLDYRPLNDQSGGGVPYNRFGILGGLLKSDGKVYLFDEYPSDSHITYGKIGYYRLGFTSPEEIRVDFRSPSTGTLTVNTSLNGRVPATGIDKTANFENAYQAQLFGGSDGRWHNITIAGHYDIQYLEFRGNPRAGRR